MLLSIQFSLRILGVIEKNFRSITPVATASDRCTEGHAFISCRCLHPFDGHAEYNSFLEPSAV